MSKVDDLIAADFTPGPLGCHEAMHMASFLAGAVDDELCDHPALILKPEWNVLAHEARDNLVALYNAIGRDHLTR